MQSKTPYDFWAGISQPYRICLSALFMIFVLASSAWGQEAGAPESQNGEQNEEQATEQSFTGNGPTPPPEFTIDSDGWQGGAFADEQTGRFGYCGIARQYENDVVLSFAANLNFLLNMSILDPELALEEATEMTVELRIDDSYAKEFTLFAGGPNLAVIPTGNDEDLVRGLRSGSRLIVSSEIKDYEFALTGTFDAFGYVGLCIQRAVELIRENPDLAPMQEEPRFMSQEYANNLLRAAGLPPVAFEPSSSIDRSDIPFLHVWRFGPLVGGMVQERRRRPVEIEEFAQRYVNLFGERCPGPVESEISEPRIFQELFATQRASIRCTDPESGDVAILSFFLTLDNFHYSLFFHEGAEEMAEQVIGANDLLEEFVTDQIISNEAEAEAEAETPPSENTPSEN